MRFQGKHRTQALTIAARRRIESYVVFPNERKIGTCVDRASTSEAVPNRQEGLSADWTGCTPASELLVQLALHGAAEYAGS